MTLERDQPVFDRILVNHLVAGNTQVTWELSKYFNELGPYTFQLQVGHSASESSDNWEDVGFPVVDTYFMLDPDQHLYGKTLDTHYRLKLTTLSNTYYSKPQNCYGILSKKDWILARELFRKEKLRHRLLTSTDGYLLKARRYGPICTSCTDEFTGEIGNSNCLTCYGTGFELGYFDPIPAQYADVGLDSSRDHRDVNKGMEKVDVIEARFLADIQIYSYDVFVAITSDERFYIHTVKVKAQIRGYPIVYDCELREAPFSDVVYKIPLTPNSLVLSNKLGEKTWKNENYLEKVKQDRK